MNETDKENNIRNSKLEMSIKPFTSVREDLTKSKSVDKIRKGISRIGQVTHYNIEPPLSQTKPKTNWESQTFLGKASPMETANLYKFSHTIDHIPSEQHRPMQFQSGMPKVVSPLLEQGLREKEVFQREIIVLEKENHALQSEIKEWKSKCHQLYDAHGHAMKKISDMEAISLQSKKRIMDGEIVIKLKQQGIYELVEQNRAQALRMMEKDENYRQLQSQLRQTTRMLNQKQTRLKQNLEATVQIQKLDKLQEIHKLEEENRKLVVKFSGYFQQKELLQSKINSLTLQLDNQYEINKTITQECKQLSFQIQDLQQDAIFGRACRKELEELSQLRKVISHLKDLNKQQDQRIQDLEQRRLNQIQIHQEETKKAIVAEIKKYEAFIRVYKEQRDTALFEKQKMVENYENIIKNIHEDYEEVVQQIKKELTTLKVEQAKIEKSEHELRDQVQADKEKQRYLEGEVERHRHRRMEIEKQVERGLDQQKNEQMKSMQLMYLDQLEAKENQISALIMRLQEITTDNTYLFQRLEQLNAKSNSSVGLVVKPPQIESLESGLCKLQTDNSSLTEKLSVYEMELLRLGDKIEISQLEIEKYKNKEEAIQKRVHHYLLEIQHLKKTKDIETEEKEVAELKARLQSQTLKLKELEHKLQMQCKLYSEWQINCKAQNTEIEQLKKAMEQQSQKLSNQILEKENQSQRHVILLESTKNELQNVQVEFAKSQECYRLLRDECDMLREKEKVKEQRLKVDEARARETRYQLYGDISAILGLRLEGEADEKHVLRDILEKTIKIWEQKKELTSKVEKKQQQYKQVLETKSDTCALAKTYQDKCLQLERLLIRMQEAHNDKLILVKQDYDVVYSKYIKYRNIVVAYNHIKDQSKSKEKEKEKEKEREKTDKFSRR